MKEFFSRESFRFRGIESDAEVRLYVISSVRLLLQQICFGLFEWVGSKNATGDVQLSSELVDSMRAPSDGQLVNCLEELLIACEQLGWTGASRCLVEAIPAHLTCVEICDENNLTVVGLLRGLVELRNNGAEGHGLVGGFKRDAEISALDTIVDILAPVIPRIENERLVAGPLESVAELSFLRLQDGTPILVRKIQLLQGNTVRVSAQCVINGQLKSFKFEAPDPFATVSHARFPTLVEWENEWRPRCYLPSRLTDCFTGREHEIEVLDDWMDDIEDSRSCMVYGDGGLGKTTLVLEYLHNFLDEQTKVSWQPKVVIFYTAKRTVWDINGLRQTASGQAYALDLLVKVNAFLFGAWPKSSFYKLDVSQACSLLQQKILKDLKLNRNDILIVVDNTETLITSDADRVAVGNDLKEIGRRIGRLIITSRRREMVQSTPIPLKDLNQIEAIRFLRDKGWEKMRVQVIRESSDKLLWETIHDMDRRPIVLEAFVGALSSPDTPSLVAAKDKVLGMLAKDLGEFLFADAWARFDPGIRALLLLMAKVSDVHDSQFLRICCDVAGVSMQGAEAAFDESGGIASTVVTDDGLQVAFSKSFLRFAATRTVAREGKDWPSEADIKGARARYSKFVKDANRFSGDRVLEAFRTPVAKAAHRARRERDIKEARNLFEQALLADATNGLLFDRFAFFLLHDMHDTETALHYSKRAIELSPEDGEVWLTKGVIEARQGDIRSADTSLNKASELGITEDRVLVQRCWAYLKAKPVQLGLARSALNRLKLLVASHSRDFRAASEVRTIEIRLDYLERYGRGVVGRK